LIFRYDKVSKRVNVHKLKGDISQHLHTKLAPITTVEEAKETVTVAKNLSFQEMVQELSENMQQKDVTISYYFICLLHLANEQVCYQYYLLPNY
jgi:condensin complex subunit 2